MNVNFALTCMSNSRCQVQGMRVQQQSANANASPDVLEKAVIGNISKISDWCFFPPGLMHQVAWKSL